MSMGNPAAMIQHGLGQVHRTSSYWRARGTEGKRGIHVGDMAHGGQHKETDDLSCLGRPEGDCGHYEPYSRYRADEMGRECGTGCCSWDNSGA